MAIDRKLANILVQDPKSGNDSVMNGSDDRTLNLQSILDMEGAGGERKRWNSTASSAMSRLCRRTSSAEILAPREIESLQHAEGRGRDMRAVPMPLLREGRTEYTHRHFFETYPIVVQDPESVKVELC